jgi:hypothetical protein
VFEVAYGQTMGDVSKVAARIIGGSLGTVRLVVVINLEYNKVVNGSRAPINNAVAYFWEITEIEYLPKFSGKVRQPVLKSGTNRAPRAFYYTVKNGDDGKEESIYLPGASREEDSSSETDDTIEESVSREESAFSEPDAGSEEEGCSEEDSGGEEDGGCEQDVGTEDDASREAEDSDGLNELGEPEGEFMRLTISYKQIFRVRKRPDELDQRWAG